MQRETVKCSQCKLIQFLALSLHCRKCGASIEDCKRTPWKGLARPAEESPPLPPAPPAGSLWDENYIRSVVTDYDELKKKPRSALVNGRLLKTQTKTAKIAGNSGDK